MRLVTNSVSDFSMTDNSGLPVSATWQRLGAVFIATAVLLLASGCTLLKKDAEEPRDIQAGTVSVTTANPATFTPAPGEVAESKAARAAWVEALCEHIADKIAASLPDGERVEVRISDIRRVAAMPGAGRTTSGSEPAGQDVVPPRIVLSFKRLSPKGKVLQTASRTLQDSSLQLKGRRYTGDKLRYEKALVDDWVSKDFVAPAR
mgnify:CR=1 FL=1